MNPNVKLNTQFDKCLDHVTRGGTAWLRRSDGGSSVIDRLTFSSGDYTTGGSVTDVKDGNYYWVGGGRWRVLRKSPMLFAHKGCAYDFEWEQRQLGRFLGSMEREALLPYLERNLRLRWATGRVAARLMSEAISKEPMRSTFSRSERQRRAHEP